jgi:hypothetical protein
VVSVKCGWTGDHPQRAHNTSTPSVRPRLPRRARSAEVDLQRLYLRWFGYWLKGIYNGVLDVRLTPDTTS